MVLLSIACCAVILLFWWLYLHRYQPYRHIPGPGILESIWNIFNVTEPMNYHLALTEMAKKYGPVMHVSKLHRELIVVSGYDALQEMLITKGMEFGGRPGGPVAEEIDRVKGILGSYDADEKWHLLRKLTQRHLKQYGEGMTALGKHVKEAAESMFQTWEDSNEVPLDPEPQILQMLVKTAIFLVIGIMPKDDDPLIPKLENYFTQATVVYTFNPPWSIIVIDMFPWLQFLGVKSWKDIQEFKKIEDDIWNEMKQRGQTAENLTMILMTTDEGEKKKAHGKFVNTKLSESDARGAVFSIVLATMITIMSSCHAAIDILAQHPDVSEKIHEEIRRVVASSNREITLDDRPMMPYTLASIYELLRYMSPAAESVPHRCTTNSTLMGYPIYKDTVLLANLWAINHDPEFWSDPYMYQPERFLDDSGELVAATHPSRQHLKAFGIGTRVCLGKSFALARLFLLITSLVQRFKVIPVNDEGPTNYLKYSFVGNALKAPDYEVILKKRE